MTARIFRTTIELTGLWLGLPHDEGGERKFLAHAGGALAAFHFVVEVGEAAQHADQERLTPAAATFGGLAFLDEHVVVLANFLGSFFG